MPNLVICLEFSLNGISETRCLNIQQEFSIPNNLEVIFIYYAIMNN